MQPHRKLQCFFPYSILFRSSHFALSILYLLLPLAPSELASFTNASKSSHLPGVHEQVPGHPCQEAQGHDAWHENSRHGIRHTLHRSPIQLSGFNETHDLAQHRFATQLLLGTFERTVWGRQTHDEHNVKNIDNRLALIRA